LRHERAEHALNLVIDFRYSLRFHARTNSAATCSSA
jgi:hypothetical protein